MATVKIIIRKDTPIPDIKRGRNRSVEYPFDGIKPNSNDSFFVPLAGRKAANVRGSIGRAFARDGLNEEHSLVTQVDTEEIDGKTHDGIRVWKVTKNIAAKRNPFKGSKKPDTEQL